MQYNQSQTYANSTRLPPNNPVTAATSATVPAIGTISKSLNAGVTAAMIGGTAAQAAAAARTRGPDAGRARRVPD